MPKQIRPFSNGSQYADWEASNCGRCKKAVGDGDEGYPCEIQKALDYACVGTGKILLEIWDRMGHDEGNYIWQCGEVDWTEEWKAEYLAAKGGK